MKKDLQLDSELKVGPSGSFEISVDGKSVLKKESLGFPTDKQVVEAVAKALGR